MISTGLMGEKKYTDILVIGGGVIGASICYYLSKNGVSTILADKSEISSGASGACDGMISLQSKKDSDLISLSLESLKLFEGLSNELSYDIEFERCGGLLLFGSAAGFKKEYDSLKDRGAATQMLEKKDLKNDEPFISSEVKGAALCRDEGHVNPINLNIGYLKAAKRNNSEILTFEKVTSFKIKEQKSQLSSSTRKIKKIVGARTINGTEIIAGQIVCACGAWSPEIGDLAGFKIPIIPRKGNLIVTEPLPEVINRIIIDYNYLSAKYEKNKDSGFTVEQTRSGNLLIGSTREFDGFSDTVDFEKLLKVIRRAKKFFPFLEDVSIIRVFSGFRPYTDDFIPFLGKIPGFENFWLAAGHEGDGIALSPVTGLIMSRLILEEMVPKKNIISMFGTDLARFSPERIIKK